MPTESGEGPTSPIPYVAPMFTFLALTALEDFLPKLEGQPHPAWYPVAYGIKIALVIAVAWASRSAWRDLWPWPSWGGLALAVALGVLVTVLWVGLDGRYPEFLGTRSGFNPNVMPPAGRIGFVAVRMLGLVVVVPLIEELFWRSFLMRWVIDPNFARVPIGRVTPLAAVVTSGLFALAHPEWLPALITGAAWAWLLWQTKSLSACFVSHAVANLGLGLYVLSTGAWKFW
jgi:CAAX prenyl protease-like protein